MQRQRAWVELAESAVEARSIASAPTRLLESAIKRAAGAFGAEMDLGFPPCFQLAEITKGLLAILEAYTEGSPGLPLIERCVMEDTGLIRMFSDIYLLSVHRKRGEYSGWSDFQMALRHLIMKAYSTLDCFFLGYNLEGSVLLVLVVLAEDDPDFDKLHTFCSDDLVH